VRLSGNLSREWRLWSEFLDVRLWPTTAERHTTPTKSFRGFAAKLQLACKAFQMAIYNT
jgi:hypothetical protein